MTESHQNPDQATPPRGYADRARDLMKAATGILSGAPLPKETLATVLLSEAQVWATLAVAEAVSAALEPPPTETAVEGERWGWWFGPNHGWATDDDGRVILSSDKEAMYHAFRAARGGIRQYPIPTPLAAWLARTEKRR